MDFISHVYYKIGGGVNSVANGSFNNPLRLYGRQLASTYGPGTAAAIVALSTQRIVGNQAGRFIGTYIIAPLVVPAAMPFIATVGGIAFGAIVELATKTAHRILFTEKQISSVDLSASDIVKEFEEVPGGDEPILRDDAADFEIIDIDDSVE